MLSCWNGRLRRMKRSPSARGEAARPVPTGLQEGPRPAMRRVPKKAALTKDRRAALCSSVVPGSVAAHFSSTRAARSTVAFSTAIPITRTCRPFLRSASQSGPCAAPHECASPQTHLPAICPCFSTSPTDTRSEPRRCHASRRRLHRDSCESTTALAANARLPKPCHPRPSRRPSASRRWTYHCELAQTHRPRTHGIGKTQRGGSPFLNSENEGSNQGETASWR